MHKKFLILERPRILMAQELNIPPDDIDIAAIYESVFRAIRESCESNKEEIIVTIRSKEEEIILSDMGQEIVNRIFTNQYPFENIAENYQDWYVSHVIEKFNERN